VAYEHDLLVLDQGIFNIAGHANPSRLEGKECTGEWLRG
jgi:hypothetical protein